MERLAAQRDYVLEPLWELQEKAKSWPRGGSAARMALSTVAVRLDTLLTVATGGKWTHVVIESLLDRADQCIRMNHDGIVAEADAMRAALLKAHLTIGRVEALLGDESVIPASDLRKALRGDL